MFDVADPKDDFGSLAEQDQVWIVELDLIPVVDALGKIVYEDIRAVVCAIVPPYERCLSGSLLCRDALLRTIAFSDLITLNDKKSILATIDRHR